MNRIKNYIGKILQNSKLNRVKFVENKKVYNVIRKKNFDLMIKRNFNSYSSNFPPNNNNNDDDNFWITYLTGMLTCIYILNKKYEKK